MIGQRIGNYRLVRVLGEGGMGVVYEGVRDDIGGRAAIKILRAQFAMNAEVAGRFVNEARAANLIDHPSIVKVFDFGRTEDGVIFLTMEFLEGESLYSRMQRLKRLTELDTIRVGRQIAAGLQAAHAKQVIHRDLKPENIMIVADPDMVGGERFKILDFGIAKLAASHGALQTKVGMVMGTPVYMSPEQCGGGGRNVGDRADVYALGVMMFEMLAGRTPFVSEDPGVYIGLHLYGQAPALREFAPGVSMRLQRMVDSMLLKDPKSRPSMAAVGNELKDLALAQGEGTAAVAASALDQLTMPLLRVPSLDPPAMPALKGAQGAEGKAAASPRKGIVVPRKNDRVGEPKADPDDKTLPVRMAASKPPGASQHEATLPISNAEVDQALRREDRTQLIDVPRSKRKVSAPQDRTLGANEGAIIDPLSGPNRIGRGSNDALRSEGQGDEAGERTSGILSLLWRQGGSALNVRQRRQVAAMVLSIMIGLALVIVVIGLGRARLDDPEASVGAGSDLATPLMDAAEAVTAAPDLSPPLDKHVLEALGIAEKLAKEGRWKGAIKRLQDESRTSTDPHLWQAAGHYACSSASWKQATEARAKLAGTDPVRKHLRAELDQHCKGKGALLRSDESYQGPIEIKPASLGTQAEQPKIVD